MGVFIIYLVKSSLCLVFFYLFNKLLLSKETFHRMNRLVWLLIVPFSLLLPFYTFPVPETVGSELLAASPGDMADVSGINAAEFISAPVHVSVYYAVRILAYIYFTGVVFFACRLLCNYLQLIRKIRRTRKVGALIRDDYSGLEKLAASRLAEDMAAMGLNRNAYVILEEENAIPFSWMNYIFIGEQDIRENGTEILRHELSHVKNFHSLDVMIIDLVLVFQWFNPAAWLLKYALQQVHEFQADDAVLASGVNSRNYQLLLIKKAVGQRMFSMVNSFNYSKLKNRIIMMSKEKSRRVAYLKYVYALPLAFFVVSAYASNEAGRMFDQVEAGFVDSNFNPDTLVINGKVIGLPAPVYIIDGKKVAPEEFGKGRQNKKGQVVISKAIRGGVKVKTIAVEDAPQKGNILIEVAGADASKESDRVIITRRTSRDTLKTVITTKVHGIEIKGDPDIVMETSPAAGTGPLKGTFKISGYMTISGQPAQAEKAVTVDPVVISKKGGRTSLRITGKGEDAGKMPLCIIDGKEASMESLQPKEIESVSVLKDKNSIYGDKGKNGVILITTKAAKKGKKSHK